MNTITLTCFNPECNKKFEKSISEYNRKKRKGKNTFFCCQQCSGYLNKLRNLGTRKEIAPNSIISSEILFDIFEVL